VVEDLDLDEVRAADLRARGKPARDREVAERLSSLITPETTMSESSMPSSR
jgi:hypothetical protein